MDGLCQVINPFINAAMNLMDVLEKRATLKLWMGMPYVTERNSVGGDISGIVGLSCNGTTGWVAVSFTKGSILKVVSSMLGERFTSINDEVRCVLIGIVNMISGQVKEELSKKGYSIQASIPAIVAGKGHVTNHIVEQRSIVIPFELDDENFIIEICL